MITWWQLNWSKSPSIYPENDKMMQKPEHNIQRLDNKIIPYDIKLRLLQPRSCELCITHVRHAFFPFCPRPDACQRREGLDHLSLHLSLLCFSSPWPPFSPFSSSSPKRLAVEADRHRLKKTDNQAGVIGRGLSGIPRSSRRPFWSYHRSFLSF